VDADTRALTDEPPTDRVLTVPNVITFVRLGLLPVFVYLLFGADDRAAAAWLLAFLGITDFLDGYIARHFHQVSELGKVLDPVADRLLFFVGIGSILIDGSVPVWLAWVVLIREVLVAGATVSLAAAGAARIDVTWFGKAGAFGFMIAFPLFLAHHSDLSWADVADDLAWVAAWPALAFSLWSVVLYVPLARKALRDGRAGMVTP
jgi:cardiolipin synthase